MEPFARCDELGAAMEAAFIEIQATIRELDSHGAVDTLSLELRTAAARDALTAAFDEATEGNLTVRITQIPDLEPKMETILATYLDILADCRQLRQKT